MLATGWVTTPSMGHVSTHSSKCSNAWRAAAPGVKPAKAVTSMWVPSATVPAGSVGGSARGEPCRKLVLLRHAESESRSNVRDHDRSLSEEGRTQALSIAQRLKEAGWVPDLVLASNAKRTKETLDEMSTVIKQLADLDAHYYGSLYTVAALDGQTRAHLQDCLLEVVDDARHNCVLLVGHNKGWEEAASSFAGHAVKLRTASAALLQATAKSWSDVLKEDVQWQLVDVLTPAHAT